MIEKKFIVSCDWCGLENHFSSIVVKRKDEVLKLYSEHRLLYEFIRINPVADDLFVKSHGPVYKYLMFCSEECAENYFKENPGYTSHYRRKLFAVKAH